MGRGVEGGAGGGEEAVAGMALVGVRVEGKRAEGAGAGERVWKGCRKHGHGARTEGL